MPKPNRLQSVFRPAKEGFAGLQGGILVTKKNFFDGLKAVVYTEPRWRTLIILGRTLYSVAEAEIENGLLSLTKDVTPQTRGLETGKVRT